MGTDRDWEKWGATDPYFGVLSREQFRVGKIGQSGKDEFFASGEKHVDRVVSTIKRHFKPDFSPKTVLDFGCGVGRLVVPFSRQADDVIGVDISRSMLAEASRNCQAENVTNVTLTHPSELQGSAGQVDLAHAYIVFQHIAWQRGRTLIQNLAEQVKPDGYLAIHIFNSCEANKLVRVMTRIRYAFPPANWVRNVIRRRPMFEPAMQLHVYDIDTVKADLMALGFDKFLPVDEPAPSGFTSMFLFAHRDLSQGAA